MQEDPSSPQHSESVGEPPSGLSKLRSHSLMKKLEGKLENLEPLRVAEWLARSFQGQDAGSYGKALTLLTCSWFLADIAGLMIGRVIPEPPAARSLSPSGNLKRTKTLEEYQPIFGRNLFNSNGKIPGEDSGPAAPSDPGGAPVKTSLPFQLIGTLILRDELRSIATIEDKSAAMVYPVSIDDEIPSKAKIIKIEARKVIFYNPSSGRREYIDLPEDVIQGGPRIQVASSIPLSGKGNTGAGVERVSATQYNINRAEVDKTLSDLNNVLTQARAVPNFENGVPNGYKLFQIVPGSIYEKLGLQNGDVITGLNGQTINDPGKAFELLTELKTANHLELQVKKDGKTQNNSYDIR